MAYEWTIHFILACCCLAYVGNGLVIYVVCTASARIGRFKYMLLLFASVEVMFATAVLFAEPLNYAYDYRMVVYSHSSIPFVAHTMAGKIAIGIYCTLFELMMGIVVLMFIYKYMVLCREHFVEKVENYWYYKVFVVSLYLMHVFYALICGVLFCNLSEIPEEIRTHIGTALNRTDDKNYLILSFKNEDGSFSIFGALAVLNHLGLSTLSGVIPSYCGYHIFKCLKEMHTKHKKDFKQDLQIFYTLVMQSVIPFTMYQIPTCVFIIDAISEKEPFLTDYMPLWCVFTAVPKVIDPIFILTMIGDYREATIRLIEKILRISCGRKVKILSETTYSVSQNVATVNI